MTETTAIRTQRYACSSMGGWPQNMSAPARYKSYSFVSVLSHNTCAKLSTFSVNLMLSWHSPGWNWQNCRQSVKSNTITDERRSVTDR